MTPGKEIKIEINVTFPNGKKASHVFEMECHDNVLPALETRATEYGEKLAFSIKETGALLGLSYITVWRLIRRGKIRTVGVTRHRVIPKAEIDRYLKQFNEP